jgi:PAS domain S-box-containing protein
MAAGEMKHDRDDLGGGFFDLSIDMLCIAGFGGHFIKLNPAWERTLGFSLEEIQSRPMIELVHPEDRSRTVEQNRKVKAGGQARSFENRYVCKDGSYRWLLWNATADRENQVIYSVAHDITERKLADEEREKLLDELQAALAEVKELQKILPSSRTRSARNSSTSCRRLSPRSGSYRESCRSARTARAFATTRTTGRRSRSTSLVIRDPSSATASARPVTSTWSSHSSARGPRTEPGVTRGPAADFSQAAP